MERMKRKLQTKAGAAIYAARKAIVEPVFGQIKQVRPPRRIARLGEGEGGVGLGMSDAQHSEVTPTLL